MTQSSSNAQVSSNLEITKDKVVYKKINDKPLEMEIYFPPNWGHTEKRVPGVILFHGGGWKGGSLRQFQNICAYLASRGLVAATANYRKLTEDDRTGLPDDESFKRVCITDAKSAIRFLKENAEGLGIDPNQLIAGGGSAGGHISVLATNNPGLNDPADSKEYNTSVVAYLLFNPAFSPADSMDTEVDVLQHLKPGFPPTISFFGTEDSRWLPGWMTVRKQLKNFGTSVETWFAEGQQHGFFNDEPWQTLALAKIDHFLVHIGLLEQNENESLQQFSEDDIEFIPSY